MFARILVCVDGSPTGRKATVAAMEMAARFGCRLTLVSVLPSTGGAPQPDLEKLVPADDEGHPVHRILEDARSEALLKGVPTAEVVLLHGKVVESILEYVARSTPDLVVVGTRGLSRGSRLLLGSVSSRLVNEAPCPVLVVRSVRRAKGS